VLQTDQNHHPNLLPLIGVAILVLLIFAWTYILVVGIPHSVRVGPLADISLERMNVHLRGKADMALTDFFVRL
jgi:hypothetical protein